MGVPDPGEEFVGIIDRISGSGNAIIQLGSSWDDPHINLGSAPKEYVGECVRARMGKDNNAYIMGFVDSTPFNIESGISIQVNDDSVEKTNEASVTGASEVEFCSCGTVMKKTESTWECPSCGKTKPEAESKKEKQNPNTDENRGETQSKGSPHSSQNSLADLRSEAVESAVEEVPETSNSTDHITTQYTRSSEVRDYVKARADGTCEGCGDAAPFISKTGEPYLHAHHIHELSNGGCDSPDTVVALCPNCHYRIHHGQDGDEFNQSLLEYVQSIEGEISE